MQTVPTRHVPEHKGQVGMRTVPERDVFGHSCGYSGCSMQRLPGGQIPGRRGREGIMPIVPAWDVFGHTEGYRFHTMQRMPSRRVPERRGSSSM